MIRAIVTHPGGAHKDDLLAVCVLIAESGAPVWRREPSADDLADPAVAVVDVGGVHAPELANFDHHHFPREHAPSCALSLVLEHLGLYAEARVLCEWLEPAEWFDSRGPNKTAQWLGVPRRAIAQLHSPIDVTLLRRFAAVHTLEPGDTVYEFMRMIGQDLLDYLRSGRARIEHVRRHAERWRIARGDATLEAVFLPRTHPPTDEPRNAVASYVRASGLETTVAATVYPDRRGTGYGMARYEDFPALDFSRVEGEPDVHFAHASGFMCKTTATQPERLQALLMAAWVGAGESA